MKIKKITAAVMAAAMAVSALSVGAYADDEKINMITAEIPADLKTSMVYFDGVGVVDITGADFDSSENLGADENANLDVDFDDLGYVSEKNLEAWRDTGVLTFGKLKTDFDTTGLQWGMFNSGNNYVQLVKRDDEGSVTERGLYKVTDDELIKQCDLDTFWTTTRADGSSIGVELVKQTVHIHTSEDDYDRELVVELNITVTQPDGTKTTETIAKADPIDTNIEFIDWSSVNFNFIYNSYWSVSSDSSKPISVSVQYLNGAFLVSADPYVPSTTEVWRYYSDDLKNGTKIWEVESDASPTWITSLTGTDKIIWTTSTPPAGMNRRIYTYDSLTEKVDSISAGSLYDDGIGYDQVYMIFDIDPTYFGDKMVCKLGDDQYYIFDDVQDIHNFESKKAYKRITHYTVDDTSIYLFEDLDGKTGYMDENEKVLAYFDDTDGFGGKYAPVVKNGKAFLVDKNMKTVSEEIDADSVVAVSDDIFIVSKGDKSYFVTYIAEEIDNPASEAVLVDYSDDASGFKASAEEGVLADGAKLTVTAVEDKTDENKFTYNITFKVGDKEVQPNGKVTVKIPVPKAFADKTIYVYRAEEDGTYTNMNAEVEDGYVVFDTDHFSIYVVTTENLGDDDNSEPTTSDTTPNEPTNSDTTSSEPTNSDTTSSEPTTSDTTLSTPTTSDKNNPGTGVAAVATGFVVLAGAAVLVTRKKTK